MAAQAIAGIFRITKARMKRDSGLVHSFDIDEWATANNVKIEYISAYIIGPEGYLCTVTTAYPLSDRLVLNPNPKNGEVSVEIFLSEIWFNKKRSFAIYDCTGRFPNCYKLIRH